MTASTQQAELAVEGGVPAFPERLTLVRPYIPDRERIAAEISEVLASGMLTNASRVRALEAAAAEYCQVKHVIAVSSCTAGLMLVYRALRTHGRVVLPSMTFSASAHAVAWAGGRPAWGDVTADSGHLDPASASELVDGAVALSATHVYGAPADVERLVAVAGDAGVPLVFDAAHALGARRGGRPVGGFGTAEVFSMSPTKVAVAGEGGLVATNDDDLAAAIRIGRDYGNPGDYDTQFVGLNARMSELHAVVALASVRRLDAIVATRNELVEAFRQAVASVPGIALTAVAPGDVSTWKDLTVLVDPDAFGLTAVEVARALALEGVDTRRYFDPPCHRQKAYADVPPERELPATDVFVSRVLTLPLHTDWDPATPVALARVLERLHLRAAQVRRAAGLS